MRVAIYNPYLDTLGGGERYTMAFAQVLASSGYRVDVQWKNAKIKGKLENRFGIKLERVNFIPDVRKGSGYEVCFWVSDGSIPLLGARNNILHFQIPFKAVNGKTLINKMKFYRINQVVCNSYFTKSFIDEAYGIKSKVIYPPVAVDEIKPRKKENLIISVGRFSQLTQAKKQSVLINVFKRVCDKGFKDWKLILAGGVEVGVDDYVDKLKEASSGYPVEIMTSPSWGQLKNLYGKARIFWSATGYKIDEKKEPQKVEHFGITVVEAMAAGAVPFVYAAGGHKEIIADSFNGFLWLSKKELIEKTKGVIKDDKKFKIMSKQAVKDSKVYEDERFAAQVVNLI